jgi:ubiquinone/menaquinone biosynthesis C-methylase UbiE
MNWQKVENSSLIKRTAYKIFYFGNLSGDRIDYYQKKIRDIEWDSIMKYVPINSHLLDVGCGTGYHLKRAVKDLNCKSFGIDPEPNLRGVSCEKNIENICRGNANKLPFKDKVFDVVFSSHALEHISCQKKALIEMDRVLKDKGIIILGVPSATMACIRLASMTLFTTHQRIVKFLLKPFMNIEKIKLIHILFPPSHSNRNKTVLNDIYNYRYRKWKKIISTIFKIKFVIYPALYPFPDYIQLFRIKKNLKRYSSSYFFICEKH